MKTPKLVIALGLLASLPLSLHADGFEAALLQIQTSVPEQAQRVERALPRLSRTYFSGVSSTRNGQAFGLTLVEDLRAMPTATVHRSSVVQPADPDYSDTPTLACTETLDFELGEVRMNLLNHATGVSRSAAQPLRLHIERTVGQAVGTRCRDIDLSGAVVKYFVEGKGLFDARLGLEPFRFDSGSVNIETVLLPYVDAGIGGPYDELGATLTRNGDAYTLRGFDLETLLRKPLAGQGVGDGPLEWREAPSETWNYAQLLSTDPAR